MLLCKLAVCSDWLPFFPCARGSSPRRLTSADRPMSAETSAWLCLNDVGPESERGKVQKRKGGILEVMTVLQIISGCSSEPNRKDVFPSQHGLITVSPLPFLYFCFRYNYESLITKDPTGAAESWSGMKTLALRQNKWKDKKATKRFCTGPVPAHKRICLLVTKSLCLSLI